MEGTSEEGPYEGCDITCDEGNMLLVDPRNGGDWRCIRSGPNYCPGKFNTGDKPRSLLGVANYYF